MEQLASSGALAPAKSRNLPVRILRAFDNAKHMLGLSRSTKDTLAELCRFVPQNEPFATIFAHKSKIAERIGASERTVYRHLEQLEKGGLIEVLPQERKSRNGRFSVARIRLTQKAAAILGFIEVEIDVFHTPPSDKMSSGQTLTEPTISKNQPATRVKNGLPIDLTWLTGLGISRAGVFALMAKAKANGKRLSDIAVAVADLLKDLRGGRLFAYLAKLATGPSDFTVQAAETRKRIAAADERRAYERKHAAFRERFRGTTLTNRAQNTLYLIDSKAAYAQVIGAGRNGTTPLTDLTPWIEQVESGRLVLATLEVERRVRAAFA